MFDIDLNEEDICAIHSPISLSDTISNEDIRVAKRLPLVISFDLVDTTGDYGFHQEMTNEDTSSYFRIMKTLSGKSIDDLEELKRELHLYHSSTYSKNLHKQLKKLSPNKDIGLPLIYHVGLYTSKNEKANREKGIRSPRIFFMMGKYGIIHILFFDPYHEILQNP